jgi:hypothetical protein
MVTFVTGADANCVVPKEVPFGELLVRCTVRAPPVVMELPEPLWRRTVIGPRFGVLDPAPETAGELMTRDSVSIVSVNVWVLLAPVLSVAVRHTV